MSSVKPATTLVFDSFSGNSLVYLIVLFRQKFPLVSVIVVVGLANLSCCCDHYVANKRDKKNVRQRTPPSEIILFWSHVTRVSLSLSRYQIVGENPGNKVVIMLGIYEPSLTIFLRLLKSLVQISLFN